MNRAGAAALLWAALHRIPEGEAAMRNAVAAMNERDGTNAEHRGTPEYSSTKRLTDTQIVELAADFRRRAGLPSRAPQLGPNGGRPRRAFNEAENVAYLPSPSELAYIEQLFGLLGYDQAGRAAFVRRQTRGRGLSTHAQCESVVAPLESMLRRRGYRIFERNRVKHVLPPRADQGAT